MIGKASGDGLTLEMMANRGVKVWPEASPQTLCTDNFRCRFLGSDGRHDKQIVSLLDRISGLKLPIGMTVSLRNYDGKAGFTLAGTVTQGGNIAWSPSSWAASPIGTS